MACWYINDWKKRYLSPATACHPLERLVERVVKLVTVTVTITVRKKVAVRRHQPFVFWKLWELETIQTGMVMLAE